MNAIFFTQSQALDVFYELYIRLKDRMPFGQVGFYVANLQWYEIFLELHPDFESQFPVVKEWEIYEEADGHKPDLERIRRYEVEFGDPTLWGPCVTDRRIYQGANATFRQDYAPQFSHEEMLAILDVALVKIDALFSEVQPQLVSTIYTATFGDVIGHMMARSRCVRAFDLRLARLKNYVMFSDGIVDPPPHITEHFKRFEDDIPQNLVNEAEDYLESVISKNAMYEGVVPAAVGRKQLFTFPKFGTVSKKVNSGFSLILQLYKNRKAPYCYDYQIAGTFKPILYRKLLNPLNAIRIKSRLKDKLVLRNDLNEHPYILYPLHTEPELVLSQFARPYLNQIEVVRNISLGIPVGMKLYLKEHPMMFGRRPVTYYEKLLQIPNVMLVDWKIPSEIVIDKAKLVAVIRGAIGLEAVMRKKPVVALGQSMFSLLPESMYSFCDNIYELPAIINRMLDQYDYQHEALLRYISAVIEGAVPVNLVSDLLGKSGRYRSDIDGNSSTFEDHPHLDLLADHLLDRVLNN